MQDERFDGYYANIKHWRTTDGHLHLSVPTAVPAAWARRIDDKGRLVYVSGDYEIVRDRYGATRYTYTVFRDGIELSSSFTGLLREAKAYAVKNARGKHQVNVA